MISVICCSRYQELPASFRQNLEDTIGEAFEWISIANDEAIYSIAEAYNKAAARARFPYLCFVHEDVLFKTKGWGRVITNLLSTETTGVIGVAGGVYKSKVFSPAWFNFLEQGNRVNIVQHSTANEPEHIIANPLNEAISRVVTLDGVFMCCRKNVWQQRPFDEKYIKGFHFYDMDFTLGIHLLGYKNYVVYNILLEHFSTGRNDIEWYKQGMLLHRKWKPYLPLTIEYLTSERIADTEYKTLEYTYRLQLNLRKRADAFISLCSLLVRKPFKKQNWLTIKHWIYTTNNNNA